MYSTPGRERHQWTRTTSYFLRHVRPFGPGPVYGNIFAVLFFMSSMKRTSHIFDTYKMFWAIGCTKMNGYYSFEGTTKQLTWRQSGGGLKLAGLLCVAWCELVMSLWEHNWSTSSTSNNLLDDLPLDSLARHWALASAYLIITFSFHCNQADREIKPMKNLEIGRTRDEL
jgi:hypothetical protein